MRILVDGMGWNGFCGFQQKIVEKGRIDTEQTPQQVNTPENKDLSIQNTYFCGVQATERLRNAVKRQQSY